VIIVWKIRGKIIVSWFIKTQNGSAFLMQAYPGYPGKEGTKRVFVSTLQNCSSITA